MPSKRIKAVAICIVCAQPFHPRVGSNKSPFCSSECRWRWHHSQVNERFWSQVRKTDDCWEWQGSKRFGYGRFNHHGITSSAHRFSYQISFGDIEDGLCVLHRCDNPACVRPDHLFLGTDLENNADRDAKGRTATALTSHPSKLSPTAVSEIRMLAANGVSMYSLAKTYGVKRPSIVNIVRRKTWRNVA